MSLELQDTLDRLARYEGSPAPILSVYLRVWSDGKDVRQALVEEFNFLLTDLWSDERDDVRQNIQFVYGFLERYHKAANEQSLAIFTGGTQLFEALRLPFHIDNEVHVGHSPYVGPLLEAESIYRRYLVIMPDREKVILMTIQGNELEEQTTIIDDTVPQKVKGRWPEVPYANREAKVQRHIDDHLHRHFDLLASKAAAFIGDKPITGVILGGHKTELSQFQEHLPKPLQDKVVGTFTSELNVELKELVERSSRVVKEVNEAFNRRIHPLIIS